MGVIAKRYRQYSSVANGKAKTLLMRIPIVNENCATVPKDPRSVGGAISLHVGRTS
jgi:hypothetical protein